MFVSHTCASVIATYDTNLMLFMIEEISTMQTKNVVDESRSFENQNKSFAARIELLSRDERLWGSETVIKHDLI